MDLAIQLVALLLALLAWVISFIQLKRQRRQNNEDLVYSQKIDAYRQTILRAYNFLQESYVILEVLSDFEGDEQSWIETKMPELFRSLNPLIDQMDNEFIGCAIFLPEEFVKRYNDFSFKCQRLLVEHYQFDNAHSSATYEQLNSMHQELINAARQDLHIKVLNEKLKYRLQT